MNLSKLYKEASKPDPEKYELDGDTILFKKMAYSKFMQRYDADKEKPGLQLNANTNKFDSIIYDLARLNNTDRNNVFEGLKKSSSFDKVLSFADFQATNLGSTDPEYLIINDLAESMAIYSENTSTWNSLKGDVSINEELKFHLFSPIEKIIRYIKFTPSNTDKALASLVLRHFRPKDWLLLMVSVDIGDKAWEIVNDLDKKLMIDGDTTKTEKELIKISLCRILEKYDGVFSPHNYGFLKIISAIKDHSSFLSLASIKFYKNKIPNDIKTTISTFFSKQAPHKKP